MWNLGDGLISPGQLISNLHLQVALRSVLAAVFGEGGWGPQKFDPEVAQSSNGFGMIYWLVVSTLTYSEKWWTSSVGMMKFPIYGKIKHVPNHQPDMYKWWFSRKPCSISDIQNFQMETLLSGLSMIVHTWAILLWYTTLSFKKTKRNIMIIKLFFGGYPLFSGQSPNQVSVGCISHCQTTIS